MKRLIIYLALMALLAFDCVAQSEKALERTHKVLRDAGSVSYSLAAPWAYGFISDHYSLSQMFIRIRDEKFPDYQLLMMIGDKSYLLEYVKSVKEDGNLNHYFRYMPYRTLEYLREGMEEGEPYRVRIYIVDFDNGFRVSHTFTKADADYMQKVLNLIEH